jgi:NADPH:quinone reductase-like Zn-dependent oxidoreductase
MGILLNCLGFGGRQLVYSAAGGEFPLDILSFYKKQAPLIGLTTLALDATQSADILKENPLFESGALKPPIVAEKYPLTEASQAYRRVASGKSAKLC